MEHRCVPASSPTLTSSSPHSALSREPAAHRCGSASVTGRRRSAAQRIGDERQQRVRESDENARRRVVSVGPLAHGTPATLAGHWRVRRRVTASRRIGSALCMKAARTVSASCFFAARAPRRRPRLGDLACDLPELRFCPPGLRDRAERAVPPRDFAIAASSARAQALLKSGRDREACRAWAERGQATLDRPERRGRRLRGARVLADRDRRVAPGPDRRRRDRGRRR